MRRLLVVLAIALLPSFALAHGGGGGGHGGGGHMGGGGLSVGHMSGGLSGGHVGGGWSGGQMSGAGMSSHAAVGAARIGGWTGSSAWGGRSPGHGRFVHHRGRVFRWQWTVVGLQQLLAMGTNGVGSASRLGLRRLLAAALRSRLRSAAQSSFAPNIALTTTVQANRSDDLLQMSACKAACSQGECAATDPSRADMAGSQPGRPYFS